MPLHHHDIGGIDWVCELCPKTVMDMVGESAARFPGRTALTWGDHEIRYESLMGRIRAVAQALGPRPGVVGVLAVHRPETIVAMLGVWAAGGAYCPIDPHYPPSRLDELVKAAGCRIVVATVPDVPAPVGVPIIPIPEAPVDGPVEDVHLAPEAAAYVLFTSGSSGSPKPVAVPHRALGAVVPALADLFGISPADRVLQYAALNWDTCLEEILPALAAGAALVFDERARSGSVPALLRAVAERGVTVLDLPTAFWHELVLDLAESGDALPEPLRLVIIGGEAVSPVRLTAWERTPGADRVRLLNTYGCTETTMITHAADLAGGSARSADGSVPIGRRLPHVVERITPEGELVIGGPAVASGYLGMPDVTAQRFVPDANGEIRFHTGDRVEPGPDGTLFHRGRLDHEFKVRGIRVNPAEVEARVVEHPDVAAAAVVAESVAGQKRMLAYLVAAPSAGPELASAVRSWLRSRVPAHLVPSRFRIVADLVHTSSGKVDKAATHEKYRRTESSSV